MVEIKNISKAFGELIVLKDISFQVEKSDNLVVLGRSGTGKSVLLKCIVGLLKPDEGEIYIEGENILNLSVTNLNLLRKNIGFLFQSSALYDSMTVRENLSFPLIRNFNFTKLEIEKKVERALDMVLLSDSINKMPSELSGGMRKRIGLARSIITEPSLMLYDEPTTGLDPITTKEISKLIRDLQSELKMTSISVTHDLICAKIISDDAIVLNEGKIIYKGSLNDLNDSKDSFIKSFFSMELIEDNNRSN